MDFTEYQKLIGKSFLESRNILGDDFELDKRNNYLSFKSTSNPKEFYGNPAYNILITNKNGYIDSIKFYFNEIIDESFYENLVNDFGYPSSIQVVEKNEVLERGINKDSLIPKYLEKRFLTTREGSFNEKPLYMIWVKKDFQIQVLLKHEYNVSEITFRIPTESF